MRLIWTTDTFLCPKMPIPIYHQPHITDTVYPSIVYDWMSYQWKPNQNGGWPFKGSVWYLVHLAESQTKPIKNSIVVFQQQYYYWKVLKVNFGLRLW